jgi:hypothetical protein
MNAITNKKYTLLSLLCLLVFSCKTSNHLSNRRIERIEKQWMDTLNSNKGFVKDWLQKRNLSESFKGVLTPDEFYVLESKEEQSQCEIVPVACYRIDSASFFKFKVNNNIPIERLLSLDKQRAAYYLKKNNKLYYTLDRKYINNQWQNSGYGPIDKLLSDSIYSLLYKKNIKLIFIYVMNRFEPYWVFKENGEYKVMLYRGRSTSFKNDLIKIIKDPSNTGEHF